MACAERTGSSGGFAKGLFEPVGQAILRTDVGPVAGSRTASVCRVGSPKRSEDFAGF